jgi:hypothetical protein
MAAAKASGRAGSTKSAGRAVLDHLDDAADGRGDDRRLARHRFEVDQTERLVDRRAHEHRGMAVELYDLTHRHHLADPETFGCLGSACLRRASISGVVGRRGAQDDLHARRKLGRRFEQMEDPLLIGDAPTNST